MIVGIGCDLTEIYRVKKALTIEKFAARVFSPAEQEYCEARGMQKFASYAARFAESFGNRLEGRQAYRY